MVPCLDVDVPCDANGRTWIDPDKVRSLAGQIESFGLLHPITVTHKPPRYSLIAGCHRLNAFILLKRQRIPAHIIIATDDQGARLRLAENAARTSLTPVEEALQLARIMEQSTADVDQLAKDVGHSTNWVLDRLDMAEWPRELLDHVHNKRISIGAGSHLAKIEPAHRRQELITFAATSGVSTRTAKSWLDQSRSPDFIRPNDPETNPEEDLRQFSTTVRVLCFVCKQHKPITEAKPAHVCDACLIDLETKPR